MSDEEFVKARVDDARCVKGKHPYPFGPIRYRIKFKHSPRWYGCNWCTTEARAWKAARDRMVSKSLSRMDE